MAKIDVNGVAVTVVKVGSEDYISLTDMMRSKDGEFFFHNWLRNRNTVEFLGTWEKVFNPEYSKADVLNEALNQARVEEIGLHIPKILEVTMIDGKWTIVSEYIAGKTLSQLMEEHPEKKNEYIEQLVDLQLEVQSKTCPLLTRLRDKMNRKISEADLDATVRYNLHTRLEGMARTYLLFWLKGDIEGAETYLDLFCKKSGTAKTYVQSWMPIVAASQSVKGNEKEREFLLSWANVVEYQ